VRYRYEDLGDDEFQQLIQALLAHALGPTMRAMPVGKADGGRDALHTTAVYQVKFTIAPDKVRDPVAWLLAALDGEIEKIRALVRRGARTYYLVTNVGGTGNLDTGTIDRLDRALAVRAKTLSIEIIPWWRETVDAQMSAAPHHLVRAFIRVLPPDQILALTRLDTTEAAHRHDRALAAYLRDQYDDDDHVRFSEVDLLGPSVHKLFVDVPVASREHGSEPFRVMAQLGGKDADELDELPASAQVQAGAARLLLHPAWRGHALIIGGPGQGKTTLLQYVCQVYRSLHLQRAEYLAALRPPHPHVARIPFRIDLRAYGEWLTKRRRRRDDASVALEEYIAAHVCKGSGNQTFTTDDLAAVIAENPVLLALDGLDEVADLAIREQVAAQIAKTARRLDAPNFDVVILVTTRPGADAAPLRLRHGFPELVMQRLTKSLQLAYLRRWAEQTELDEAATESLRRQFIANQNLPHVRELGASPMQLAILLHLLQRRGILPEQRTQLYADYVQVFFDRERPKEPIIARHHRLVVALHRYLGWYLQAQAELGHSSGQVGLDDIKRLIGEFLRDYDEDSPDLTALFTSVTSRVVCLVQRKSGSFEFEVQPLREYFAACYLAEGAPLRGPGTKDARLAELMKRPYWSNVLRFFVGLLSEAEIKSMPTTVREVRAAAPFSVLPLTRAVLIQLLRDQVYQGMTAVAVHGAVDAALEGPGCVLAADGLLDDTASQALALPDGAGATQISSYARQRLQTEPDPHHRAALAQLLCQHDQPERIRDWWWSDEVREATIEWLRTAAHLRVLSGLTRQQVAHVRACLHGAGAARRYPVLPLLAEAASDVDDDELMRACVAELGDGHGQRRTGEPATLLDTLLAWSDPGTFFAHRQAAYRATGGAERVTQRRRRRRGSRAPTTPKELADQLRAVSQATDWETEEAWWRLLDVLEAGFGDSWLLREAVLATPDELAPSASGAQLNAGAEPGAVAAWLRQARHHNHDSEWWLAQSPADGDSLAARTWLVALALYARAQVVEAGTARMEQLLAGLSDHEAATVIATVDRYCSHAAPRRLDLYEPLHQRVMALSGPAALLLYPVAFDSTRVELARAITDKLTDVLTLRADVARLALTAVGEHQTRDLRPSLFQGTRHNLARGTLRDARIATVSTAVATRMLNQPGQWPSDLVATAALVLSAELSKLPPLAHVARDNHWFGDA
jgi:hypothetical protein